MRSHDQQRDERNKKIISAFAPIGRRKGKKRGNSSRKKRQKNPPLRLRFLFLPVKKKRKGR